MEKSEYIKTQLMLIKLSSDASTLDLDGFTQEIIRAETMGPVIDPTNYIKAADRMRLIKKLAIAAKELVRAHQELINLVVEENAKQRVSRE